MNSPPAYSSRDHETLGSDVLAVEVAIRQLVPSVTLRRPLLGPALNDFLARVKPEAWYPVRPLLDLFDRIGERGSDSALHKVGRLIFDGSHRERVMAAEGPAPTARLIFDTLDTMYRHSNRGEGIGGWAVMEFARDHAVLEKTTPHPCIVEEGILWQALQQVGAPAVITHEACVRSGAPACRLHVMPVLRSAAWQPRPTVAGLGRVAVEEARA